MSTFSLVELVLWEGCHRKGYEIMLLIVLFYYQQKKEKKLSG